MPLNSIILDFNVDFSIILEYTIVVANDNSH